MHFTIVSSELLFWHSFSSSSFFLSFGFHQTKTWNFWNISTISHIFFPFKFKDDFVVNTKCLKQTNSNWTDVACSSSRWWWWCFNFQILVLLAKFVTTTVVSFRFWFFLLSLSHLLSISSSAISTLIELTNLKCSFFLLLLCLLPVAGKSDISFVDVTPCEQEPCYFVKGRNFTLSMDGRASKSTWTFYEKKHFKFRFFVFSYSFFFFFCFSKEYYSSGVTFEFTIDYLGTSLPLPDLDSNGCNYLNCPIRRNERLQIKYPLLARSYFPDVSVLNFCLSSSCFIFSFNFKLIKLMHNTQTTGKMVWKLLGDNDKIIGCIEAKIGIGPL